MPDLNFDRVFMRVPNKQKRTYKKWISPDWRKSYKRNTDYWNNKGEFEKVGELEERMEDLRESVQSNCYWGMDGGRHTSWHDRWDYLTKIVNMWHGEGDADDLRPNLKSTFAYNACEVALAELYDLNLMPAVIPWTDKGEKYAQIAENIIKYPIVRNNFNEDWLDVFQEGLWLGNSFMDVDYTKILRRKKFKKLKDFSKDELKKLEKGEEIAIYVDKEYIEYNDVNWIPISPYEYYPDSYARRQHGLNFAADDGIWERMISFPSFKSEFTTKKGFKNLDKIKPGMGKQHQERMDNPVFKFPEEYNGDDVVVRRWQSKSKDLVRYTANGVWIGDFPLPNHGQLSVVHIGAMKIPGQYYYMGMADVIEGLQTEDEQIRNKFLELLDISLRPPIIAGSTVAGEFKDQYEVGRYNVGEIISIEGSPQDIQFMAPPMTKLSEVFGLRSQIREDVISVSLIDPASSRMQSTKAQTATEKMALMQATMKTFSKLLQNFSRGIRKGLQIQWALQKQEYPLQMEPETIKGKAGESSKTMFKSRQIYTKDLEIIDAKDGIEVNKKPGQSFPLKIKDEYLDLEEDDIDIIIDPESMQPESKISRVKKTEEAWAQLLPIYMQEAQEQGIPISKYEPIQILKKNYILAHELDTDQLGSNEEDEDEAKERAIEQNGLMLKNVKLGIDNPKYKPVLGIFDEPTCHRNEHLKALNAANALIKEKEAELADVQSETELQMSRGVQPTQEMVTSMGEMSIEVEFWKKYKEEIKTHLEVDKMTEAEAEEALLAEQTGMGPGQMQVPSVGPQPQGMGMSQTMGGMGEIPGVPSPTPTSQQDLTQMTI